MPWLSSRRIKCFIIQKIHYLEVLRRPDAAFNLFQHFKLKILRIHAQFPDDQSVHFLSREPQSKGGCQLGEQEVTSKSKVDQRHIVGGQVTVRCSCTETSLNKPDGSCVLDKMQTENSKQCSLGSLSWMNCMTCSPSKFGCPTDAYTRAVHKKGVVLLVLQCNQSTVWDD